MVFQLVPRNLSSKLLFQSYYQQVLLSVHHLAAGYSTSGTPTETNELPINKAEIPAEPVVPINEPSFEELLHSSKLMKFGRADSKCVVGRITDVCNEDLYIDYGGKFECVATRPEDDDPEFYKKGKLMRLLLLNHEMTGVFLGDERHITVCEARGYFLGRYLEPDEDKLKKKI